MIVERLVYDVSLAASAAATPAQSGEADRSENVSFGLQSRLRGWKRGEVAVQVLVSSQGAKSEQPRTPPLECTNESE